MKKHNKNKKEWHKMMKAKILANFNSIKKIQWIAQ
jgi:hypothetical protein